MGNLIRADFLKARYTHIYHSIAVYFVLISVLYIVFTDTWIFAPTESGAVGFFHNIMGQEQEYYRIGYTGADISACASVAHTIFFSVYCIIVVYILFGKEMEGHFIDVSFAHGVEKRNLFFSKLLLSTVVLQGSYIAISFFEGLIHVLRNRPENLWVWFVLSAGKILLSCLVLESFICFCMMLSTWIVNQTIVAAVEFLFIFVGLVVELANVHSQSPILMLHCIYFWIRVCGLCNMTELVFPTIIYSVLSCFMFSIVAYRGVLRENQK